MVLDAPFDGGTAHRPGTRFGPQAIRTTDDRVVLEALSAIARRGRDARDGTRWNAAVRLLAERPPTEG